MGWNMTFTLACHASLSCVPYSGAFSILSGGYVAVAAREGHHLIYFGLIFS